MTSLIKLPHDIFDKITAARDYIITKLVWISSEDKRNIAVLLRIILISYTIVAQFDTHLACMFT